MNVWNAYWQLNDSRQHTDAGPQAFTFTEIEAFLRLTRSTLSAWELETLRLMDATFQNAYNHEQREAAERRKQQNGYSSTRV